MLICFLTEIKLLMLYLLKTKAKQKLQPFKYSYWDPSGDEEMVAQRDKEYSPRSNSWVFKSTRITEKSQVPKAEV